ncbi:FYVE-type zinc finger-containing protein [Heterostelium album PN500]|uniref:FYVE-type zinc finger-containing protein n=1 Tax=Heterostelium pallidum (strain ATCC 26659 / Pp 5 / PN500) TaxID=670386 RepID=D3AW39_HETP5|nr:FYVE-type zinc finger-containing protein [Heterostelium album PN500]EFA86512.1 FYVE-type zinc finger-containing protein [Heterostelium album PN500]|eukprot:XP_020438617.1 FYVE-type zinc finger-containing protein [Heterostelium album PN500]
MTTFTPRMTSALVDTLPPLPPSTSQNIPLQVSSNEMCSVHVELEKSYFVNGETINGTVHLTLYQRQFLHTIQIHLGGFEKIYIQSMLNSDQHNHLNLHNNNHIIPFYSESRLIFPSSPQQQQANTSHADVGIPATSSTTSTSYSPTGSASKLSAPLGSSSSSIPSSSSSSSSSSNNNLPNGSNNSNSNNPHTAYRYTAPTTTTSTNGGGGSGGGGGGGGGSGGLSSSQTIMSPVLLRSNDAKELEPGTYHYSFSIQLPRYLAPSLNYIDFLSIFYIAKCVIEYSKGREWQETSIARSTEFFVHGVGNSQLTRLMMQRRFVDARVSRFLWTNKSRPIEMAIFLMLPGSANKQPLASTKMLTANFDIRNSRVKDNDVSSAQFQVTIPQMVGDDVVYPSTRGCISRIKHYFKVSIPSVKVETIIKFNLHGRLVGEEQMLSPRASQPIDWQVSWMPTWVKQEDKSVKCTLCAEQFNIIIRKHHCRSCGNVFCGKCASSKLYLKKFGVNERVRVCALCHDDIVAAEERDELNTPKKRYQPHLVEYNKSSNGSNSSSSNSSQSNSLNNSTD